LQFIEKNTVIRITHNNKY